MVASGREEKQLQLWDSGIQWYMLSSLCRLEGFWCRGLARKRAGFRGVGLPKDFVALSPVGLASVLPSTKSGRTRFGPLQRRFDYRLYTLVFLKGLQKNKGARTLIKNPLRNPCVDAEVPPSVSSSRLRDTKENWTRGILHDSDLGKFVWTINLLGRLAP